jgi:hypothetical protein
MLFVIPPLLVEKAVDHPARTAVLLGILILVEKVTGGERL